MLWQQQNTQVVVMYPSLGSARLGSARFWLELLKKKLGSARYVFEKARFLKNAQNEPKNEAIIYFQSKFLKIIVIA